MNLTGIGNMYINSLMKAKSLSLFKAVYFAAAAAFSLPVMAQNQSVAGNLTVEGRADLIAGPLSLGTSSFTDELDNETTAEGLTIHYSEIPQIWSGGNFVQGRSSIVQRVGQELADFYWQTSEPDGLGGFAAVDLMKLSNEQLLVQPSIVGQGTLNLLPNQTLSGGNGSILTLGLADNRYLSNAGGTIAGNLTITGSDVTINGSKVLTEADEVHFMQHVDGSYIGEASYATPWSSAVAIGHFSRAGESAIAIGAHTGMWEPGTSGVKSVAIGYSARAPGAYSIAIGESNWGGGNESIAIGREAATQAEGALSFGRSTKANQVGQIVMGAFNVESVYSETPLPADSLFILGNGTADNARSNALVVKRNGDMEVMGTSLTVNGNEVLTEGNALTTFVTQTAASTNFIAKDAVDSQLPNQVADHVNSILTKGIADGLYLSSGSLAGISFKFGSETIATSEHSIVLGHRAKANTNAISIGSFASNMGEAMASGTESVALGYVARAPGDRSVALGYATWSGGADSVSIMNGSAARTDQTIAIGKGIEATRPGQVALGSYNVYDYVAHTSSPGDQIFVIGNGTADNARSNALVVKRNGDMEVKGNADVSGKLTVTDGAEISGTTTVSGVLLIVSPAGGIDMGEFTPAP